MQKIIEFKNVSFEYTPGAKVLDGVNLSVEKGDFVAIVGANGSGKSTLAKHMNGVLAPTAGCVLVNGIDTADEDRLYDVRRTVGMVFQNPDNQIVATLVEEDVAFALENLGVEPAEIRRRVDAALETVGMTKHKLESPAKLSGGQKQRVAIAGILAMAPECIVLDEPTAMLDPKGKKRIMRTVAQLNEQGITVVLITHFMDEAATAKRVVALSQGKIVKDGTPREVFADVAGMRALGLDVPVPTELLHILLENGARVRTDAVTNEACVEILCALLEGSK
ncbi:MAG: energy-coupling factor transporter ATPase [Oscillospiraceae bacterium]|nr:energy-coupling factor transporter ATPase [Oscillospiraceae bacterium]